MGDFKRDFGELYMVSMHCRYGYDIGPYLAYMDRVREYVKGGRLLVWMLVRPPPCGLGKTVGR